MPDNSSKLINIGLIQDWAIGCQTTADFQDAVRLAFEEATANGLIDRPVNLIIRDQEAPPYGTTEAVVDTWQNLVDEEDVLCVIGPQVHEPCIALREATNRRKIPLIAHCITFDCYGDYCFIVPNGTFSDEAVVMANYLKRQGYQSVAVINDDANIGSEYLKWFKIAARRADLKIAGVERVNQIGTAEEITPNVAALKELGADALLYLGNGHLLPSVSEALDQLQWHPPRMMNLAFVQANVFPARAPALEGWLGVDQYDESNPVYQSLQGRFEKRYGRRPNHTYLAIGFDMGNVIAEGIALTDGKLAPETLKQGLEQVRMLPAALGSEGNVLSFAPYDHRAYKGRYLVVRRINNDVNEFIE